MNRSWRLSTLLLLSLGFLAFSVDAQEQTDRALDLNELLEQVKEGRVRDNQINQQRLADFRGDRARQQERLNELAAEEAREEAISVQRETMFEENELLIGELEERLTERLGSLKELFGVLQQVAGDAQGNFSTSLTQIHGTERSDYLTEFAQRMGQTTDLPTIEEIERLWYELQWEMTETGRVAKVRMPVLTIAGEENGERLGTVEVAKDNNQDDDDRNGDDHADDAPD